MFPEILSQNEGKTLEFKENTKSIGKILKTVIAFANTAGGIIIIGVEDGTKKIIGVENILLEEERVASIIADSIEPMILPDIEILNYENNELLVINVPYLPGPHYHKKAGMHTGTFIRLGSTNRLADNETIATLLRVAKHVGFDELPCTEATQDDLDDNLITQSLTSAYNDLQKQSYSSLGLVTKYHQKNHPTYGGLLLFCKDRISFLPDSAIRCVCFSGRNREKIIDQKDITSHLILAVDEIIAFIDRHTNLAAKIGKIRREDIPQFPPHAVREAVINALVHADYALTGSSIQIAVFSDRIEITNPGCLPFGQTLASALSGISRMRNRMIGRIFRELKIIERLGSGIPRIFASYVNKLTQPPKFEEIDTHFRVTLYEVTEPAKPTETWELALIHALSGSNQLATKDIATLWKVTVRTARIRLKNMLNKGLIETTAISKTDPTAQYKLKG